MADQTEPRVAVYIDFDNIVISRYDQVHGRGQFGKDRARSIGASSSKADVEVRRKIADAKVSVDAILDYASSFGSLVISRAYADWSVNVNADYRNELNGRAVDLTQLFNTTTQFKNGADIRLAIDVVDDLFRLADITHVVIVAGDSDYIPLAQRCRRLGRYVIGIGVLESTGKYLSAACDEFAYYGQLPGIDDVEEAQPNAGEKPVKRARSKPDDEAKDAEPSVAKTNPTDLLVRAMRVGHAKSQEEWLHSGGVKSQMQRMDPSFNEKTLGFGSFSEFLKSRESVVEMGKASHAGELKLRAHVLETPQ